MPGQSEIFKDFTADELLVTTVEMDRLFTAKTTFLEHVAIAAREPVYTAAFAWVLGEDSPLPPAQRVNIVAALCGSNIPGEHQVIAHREWKHIDLLLSIDLDTGPVHVAIENKIKTAQGPRQLEEYDKSLATLPGDVHKILLTLTGDKPQSGRDWSDVPYSRLLNALRACAPFNSPHAEDLRDALARLVAVADAAHEPDGRLAGVAFEGKDASQGSPIESYVDKMRLGRVVQRIWMTDVAARLNTRSPWTTHVAETNGQALLNVEAQLEDHQGVVLGLQLQRRSLKAFVEPWPYGRDPSDAQSHTVEEVLERFTRIFPISGKPSTAKHAGFRSFQVGKMPEGRKRNEWVGAMDPYVSELIKEFPTAKSITLDADRRRRGSGG